MPGPRKVPQGRLGRVARLAAVGARTGASLLLPGDGRRAAAQAAEILGTLRGLAAKVGQMAGYVDGLIPEGQRDAYESALASLRAAAPRSDPEAIRRMVKDELGDDPDRLFASWDDLPFASASIGQVHRATLHDGTPVAVKVQHPGIDRALENDLKNAGVIETLVSTLGPKGVEARRTFLEVAARFREELDYRHEAEQQTWFREFHAGDPSIRIPKVIVERSAQRVLTTELAQGLTLEQAMQAPEQERHAWAETLWRFVFRGNLIGGRFNADPHPGNYLFGEEGRVTFLDFGCVQPIAEENQTFAHAMHRAALARDEAAFEAAARSLLRTRGGVFETFVVRYTRDCFDPLFTSPFRITRGYVKKLVTDLAAAKRVIFKKNAGTVPLPPGMALMNRLQFGFYSVLARLDAEVDYARIERGFLEASEVRY